MQRLAFVTLMFLMCPTPSLAATISVDPTSDTISVGQQTTLHLDLMLDEDEVASTLELKLELEGLGVVAAATLVPCMGWGGLSAGAVGGLQATASCTAGVGQKTGRVASAEISVVGLAPGVFRVVLADGTFVKRDTDVSPFVDDVSLSTSTGRPLATVTIVPEPSTALLLASGLFGMAAMTRRTRAPHYGVSRHARSPASGALCPMREQ